MSRETPNITAIVGPTASGKTALAIALARRFDGEIVSCDSMQIYRGMDIGTAKPTVREQQQVKHHMIDVASPEEEYSCAAYAAQASEVIREILSRGKMPILCGGTGLYLDSVLFGNRHAAPKADANVRAELRQKTPQERYRLLEQVDPVSAAATHPNNEVRVLRALEIFLLSGKPKSVWDEESKSVSPTFSASLICLEFKNRQLLYDRIDRRVDEMVERGLFDEVSSLTLPDNSTAAQAIGYKEVLSYLHGSCSRKEAIDEIKMASRRYAKRQMTWFRRYDDCFRIPVDFYGFEEIVNIACDFLTKRQSCAIIDQI